jgi:hypothetical protein
LCLARISLTLFWIAGRLRNLPRFSRALRSKMSVSTVFEGVVFRLFEGKGSRVCCVPGAPPYGRTRNARSSGALPQTPDRGHAPSPLRGSPPHPPRPPQAPGIDATERQVHRFRCGRKEGAGIPSRRWRLGGCPERVSTDSGSPPPRPAGIMKRAFAGPRPVWDEPRASRSRSAGSRLGPQADGGCPTAFGC